MKYTPASIEGEHVVLTGPITGTVTLDDGTVVDVTRSEIGAESPEQAAEIAHKVGLRYAEEGHPAVPDGFVYDEPKKSAKKKG